MTEPGGAVASQSETPPPATGAFGERELIARAVQGDQDAFRALYDRHLERVYGLVVRWGGSLEAEEITQDVFVRAWEKLYTFRGDAALSTWLYRVGVSVILARRKAAGKARQRFAPVTEVEYDRASPPDRPDQRMDLEAGMATLPEGARRILLLHDVSGYRHDEIATMLGISAGTSKSQLHRARMALRRHLHRGEA